MSQTDTQFRTYPCKPFGDRNDRIEAAAIYVAGALEGIAAAAGDDEARGRVALIGLASMLRQAVSDE